VNGCGDPVKNLSRPINGSQPPNLKGSGLETALCIRKLNMRYFAVKTLAGHEFVCRSWRRKDENEEPKLFFV
jgi:hypothetical protein